MEEVKQNFQDVERRWEEAQWNLENTNSREEYEGYIGTYNEAEANYNNMVTMRDNAQAVVDEWETLGPNLEEAYNNKKSERESIRAKIIEYDPDAEVNEFDATRGDEPQAPPVEGEEGQGEGEA